MRFLLYTKQDFEGKIVNLAPSGITEGVAIKGSWRGECPVCACGNRIIVQLGPLDDEDKEYLNGRS